MRMTSLNRSTSSGLQDLLIVILSCSTMSLRISSHGSLCSVDSASSQPAFWPSLPNCWRCHFSLIVSGLMNPSGSYRDMVRLRMILLVRTASSKIPSVSFDNYGPAGEYLRLWEILTVSGMVNLSVSVLHFIPSTAPPNFWTTGPSLSPEHAITLRMNPPLAKHGC